MIENRRELAVGELVPVLSNDDLGLGVSERVTESSRPCVARWMRLSFFFEMYAHQPVIELLSRLGLWPTCELLRARVMDAPAGPLGRAGDRALGKRSGILESTRRHCSRMLER